LRLIRFTVNFSPHFFFVGNDYVRRGMKFETKGTEKIIAIMCFARVALNLFIPPPQNVGGGAILDSLCRVGRSVRPSPIRVRSITPLLMEGFPSNVNDTFNSTRGCAESMLPMCQLKVRVTVKGQILNKQILHIMSCPLYNFFSNGRISFNLE